MRMSKRGALIVVEGIDKSGKSTQCELLVNNLNKKEQNSAKLMKFPDRTTVIGKTIDSYLKKKCELDDHAVHLLFSANRWEASHSMREALSRGKTLVVDRYAFSGVAYSAAKVGMDMTWCKLSDSGLPKPDLVMFLTLTAEEAEKRSDFGRERYEKTEFQERVHKNFEILSAEDWKWVDAGRTKEAVQQEMLELTEEVKKNIKGMEIGKLWPNK